MMAWVDQRRVRLVRFARKQLGKPYRYGAKSAHAPKEFDCSSFTQYLYRRIGMTLPRTALEQAHLGRRVPKRLNQLQVGDLLFIKGGWGRYDPTFRMGIGHVAVCVGDGKVIHAKWQENLDDSDGGAVIEEPADQLLKRPDVVVIKRILD